MGLFGKTKRQKTLMQSFRNAVAGDSKNDEPGFTYAEKAVTTLTRLYHTRDQHTDHPRQMAVTLLWCTKICGGVGNVQDVYGSTPQRLAEILVEQGGLTSDQKLDFIDYAKKSWDLIPQNTKNEILHGTDKTPPFERNFT